MKWIKNLSIGLVLMGAVDSCIKEPTYDVVPHIELASLVFKKGVLNASQQIADTLIIKLKFTDGDGDLGVGNDDALLPQFQTPIYAVYNTTTLAVDSTITDKSAPLPSGYKFLQYEDRRNIPQFAKLPDLSHCDHWEGSFNDATNLTDTLYIIQNLKAFNITLDIFTKNTSTTPATYDPFDPRTISKNPLSCTYNLFRNQFPDLSNDRQNSPLDGTITWRIEHFGIYSTFGSKTLKMEFTVYDRAFHQSKSVIKEGFTLQQITK